MTPRRWGVGGWLVAVAAGLVGAGGLVGLLVWNRQYFLLALAVGCSHWFAYWAPTRNLRAELANRDATLDAWNLSAKRTDLDVVGTVSPPRGTAVVDDPAPPSWMDQSGYRPPRTLATGHDGEWVDISDSVQSIEVTPGRPVEPLTEGEIVHRCPYPGESVTPCCGRSPFELPLTDRLTLSHEATTCPNWDGPAEQPFVHTPCGTPISVDDAGGEWCPTCQVEITHEAACSTCGDSGMVPAGGHGSDGFDRCPDCQPRERCGDISPVTGASCQHPPGHTIRHVGPLGEGTYRERWGDFPDLDASDGPRSLPTPKVSD